MTANAHTFVRRFLLQGRTELWVFGFATALSLIFSIGVYPGVKESLHAKFDPDRIGELAKNLCDGKGFQYSEGTGLQPALDRAPVYPYLVASLFWLFGAASPLPIQIVQAIFHGLTGLTSFLLARRLFGRECAIVVQVLCAVHPMLIWYTSRIWVETLHTLLFTFVALAVTISIEKPSVLRFLGTGIVVGIASLTKGVLLPFSLILGALFLVHKNMRMVKYTGLMLVVSVLMVAPWTIRNYQVSGEVVPIHTSVGLNMVQGDALARNWSQNPFSTVELQRLGQGSVDSILQHEHLSMTEPKGDRLLMMSSLSYNFTHPLFLLKRMIVNAFTFWYLSDSAVKSICLFALQLPLVVGLFWFVRRFRNEKPAAEPLVFLIAFYFAIHLFIIGWARYSLPILPLCLILVTHVVLRFRRAGPLLRHWFLPGNVVN